MKSETMGLNIVHMCSFRKDDKYYANKCIENCIFTEIHLIHQNFVIFKCDRWRSTNSTRTLER